MSNKFNFTVRCPEGWFPWDNSCYRHEPETIVDEDVGQDICINRYNANLFVPNSKDEADAIKNYLAGIKVIAKNIHIPWLPLANYFSNLQSYIDFFAIIGIPSYNTRILELQCFSWS